MMKPLCALAVCLAVLAGAAMADEELWEVTALGETAIVPMEAAPFPHESREEGYTNSQGNTWPKDPHYIDNSVAIFVPKGYEPGDTVDLLFYFHGHGSSIEDGLARFNLREMVAESGKNVILVFPEGPRDAGDSSGGRLEEPGAFRAICGETLEFLRNQGKTTNEELGRVILSGHSGAYRVISFALEHGGIEEHIVETYLLDASYARLEQYTNWVVRNPRARLRSVFTDHLAPENVAMMTSLERACVDYKLMNDQSATPVDYQRERVLFLHTVDRGHNQAVELLGPWLKASVLDDRPDQ